MSKDLYLISGLGADKRVFDYLDLDGFKLNHIEWIKPLKDEKIQSYSKRLLQQVKTGRPTVIGVSFGGMIGIEMAKHVEIDKLILISSVKRKEDIPFRYRLAGNLWMNKLIPAPLYRKTNFLVYWLFGVTKKKEKELLTAIMDDADNDFVDWATNAIVTWDNDEQVPNIITVHGTADRIFPFKEADYKVEKGGHLMIVTKADEVSRIIRGILG